MNQIVPDPKLTSWSPSKLSLTLGPNTDPIELEWVPATPSPVPAHLPDVHHRESLKSPLHTHTVACSRDSAAEMDFAAFFAEYDENERLRSTSEPRKNVYTVWTDSFKKWDSFASNVAQTIQKITEPRLFKRNLTDRKDTIDEPRKGVESYTADRGLVSTIHDLLCVSL